MNLWQCILEALESVSANKMRTGLTILGIVIGVAAVIAMLGVGQGAQNTITGAIGGIGTNLLFVFTGNLQDDVRNPRPLTLGDAQALQDELLAPAVKAVAPVIQGSAEVSYEGKSSVVTVEGITPTLETVRNYSLLEGEFITDEHLLGRSSVVLLGATTADKLFGRRTDLVGETVRIDGQPFRVLGVLSPKGGSAFGSSDQIAMIPLTTSQARITTRGRDQIDLIMVQAEDADKVKQAIAQITDILRIRHRILLGSDDFTILSQQDFVETAKTVTGVMTIFLGGIAAISLLVGGIGIMNIMMVSVVERTREIGLRKALGARRRDILLQFLTESALLSFFGGVIGIGLGELIAYVVGRIAVANNTPFTPVISLDAILLATLFSTAVGLFFGIYPANRAASLEPVEALRME